MISTTNNVTMCVFFIETQKEQFCPEESGKALKEGVQEFNVGNRTEDIFSTLKTFWNKSN